MDTGTFSKLTPLQKALLALEKTEAKLVKLEAERNEPIAVIGVGCRFPGGGNGREGFWRVLSERVETRREVPKSRWDVDKWFEAGERKSGKVYVRHGAYLDSIDEFDAEFFGISPKEARAMDPQQRLLLEVCWEALEDAGLAPAGLARTRTGLFLGLCLNEYMQLLRESGNEAASSIYAGTGNGFSFAAGRLSYTFGFQGPCIALDTACSSSLVTVHLACQSLHSRETDVAIAGGVQLILLPETNVMLCDAGALAPDGRCKAFDAAANGYARGEGCGLVVLKRLSDAIAASDRILGVLRGSATNHGGSSSGLTVPNGLAQQAVLREALANAHVHPDAIDYVEAHGTGTPLGDPIELRALGAVMNHGRTDPLWIGTVKSNIGHLEGAAGIAGLIKVLLALDHELLPAQLHFEKPNPHIPWNDLNLSVLTEERPWKRGLRERLAGVSSFGISGSNAHVIVGEAPVAKVEAVTDGPERKTRVPTRPFQRQRFWIDAPAGRVKAGWAEAVKPKRLCIPLVREKIFEVSVGMETMPFLGDHRIFQGIVVPGAFHVAFLLGVAVQLLEESNLVLNDLVFSSALSLGESDCRTLQAAARLEESGDYTLEVASFLYSGIDCQRHGAGRFSIRTNANAGKEMDPLDKCKTRCSEPADVALFYENLASRQVQLGPAFHWIESIWKGADEALGRLRRPSVVDRGSEDSFHPGLIDSCFQLLGATVPTDDRTMIPFHLSQVRCGGGLNGDIFWCHVAVKKTEGSGGILGDVRLFDEEGRVVLAVDGLEVRSAAREAFERSESEADFCYYPAWVESEVDDAGAMPGIGEGWWVVSDGGDLGERLAKQLGGARETIRITDLLASSREEVSERFGAEPIRGIVYCCGSAEQSANEESIPSGAMAEGCILPLRFIQTLLGSTFADSLPPVWFVTVASQSVVKEAVRLEGSPLWGLVESVRLEHPELRCRCLDIDPAEALAGFSRLLPELLLSSGEAQVSIRHEKRFVRRLRRMPLGDAPENVIRADKAYLITGGLGALGLRTALWLAERGARAIWLSGRRTPSEAAMTTIHDLEAMGVRVMLYQGDLSRGEDTEKLLLEIERAGVGLAGIIHAAGVLEDAVVRNLTEEGCKRVLDAKIGGAWNLHRATHGMTLDFFVMYSSAASILGAVGQAHYAAANAFMNSLAEHRISRGLTGLSVCWGPWEEVGMALRLTARQRKRLSDRGIRSLRPKEAFQALERLLDGPRGVAMVMPVNWTSFASGGRRVSSLVQDLLSADGKVRANVAVGLGVPFLKRLRATTMEARKLHLEGEVIEALVGALGFATDYKVDPERGFSEMGMDSMMAVDLRNELQRRFECVLPATVMFRYPTLNAITGFLMEELFSRNGSEPARGDNHAPTKRIDDIENASMAELTEMLEREMNDLQNSRKT